MKMIYLFNDNGSTRIPVCEFEFDKYLHSLLTDTGGGVWKADNREYFFNRRINADKLRKFLPDTPIIQVNENHTGSVTGFFNRKWNDDDKDKYGFFGKKYFTEKWQEKLRTELHSRKYSKNTIALYIHYNISMCQWLKKTPENVTEYDVKSYLAFKEQVERQSAATLNIALSAFKFFYRFVLRNNIVKEQKRPRQDKRLPIVLSKKEVKDMIELEKNLKHQLLLMIVYSSGLRVSEVVSLKKQDVDVNRKSIIIQKGKGRKDRYTITSDKVIRVLSDYFQKYEINDWLFPGQPATRHLTKRSAQHIFDKAVRRAGIIKTASIHSLRHSFATHLLESGIDVMYIKDLLGHSSVRTTERYTHVARRKALNIISPLDDIGDEEELSSEW